MCKRPVSKQRKERAIALATKREEIKKEISIHLSFNFDAASPGSLVKHSILRAVKKKYSIFLLLKRGEGRKERKREGVARGEGSIELIKLARLVVLEQAWHLPDGSEGRRRGHHAEPPRQARPVDLRDGRVAEHPVGRCRLRHGRAVATPLLLLMLLLLPRVPVGVLHPAVRCQPCRRRRHRRRGSPPLLFLVPDSTRIAQRLQDI